MRRAGLAAAILIGLATLGGCTVGRPSYDEVRDQTVAALQAIVDLIPSPRTVDVGPEQEPYSCSDPLLPSRGEGSFYTGHWTAEVSETFDIAAFIETLPATLGHGWTEEDLGIDVSFATVDLIQESTGVSVAVEDHSVDGRRVIDVLAISRCGILSDEERSPRPSPFDTKSPAPLRYKR